MDSVHPLLHGYRLLCDMYENEISLLTGKTRKRSGEAIQPPPKRARAEPRPAWIETRDRARSARTGRQIVDEAEAVEDSPTQAEVGLTGEGGVEVVAAEAEGVAAKAEDELQPPQLEK